MTQEEIDALIRSGGAEESTAQVRGEGTTVAVSGTDFPAFETTSSNKIVSPLDPKLELLYDLQLPVSIELGRTHMLIRDIFRLGRGSVVEFDRLASEPVDLLVNGKKIAEGEVVVIDKHFGIRITSLVDPSERLKVAKR